MIQDPARRLRARSILRIIILATIPCYLLGLVVLWISNGTTASRTATATVTPQLTSSVLFTPTLPLPTSSFPSFTPSLSATSRFTATITPTYSLPTSTPSVTPSSTLTVVPTDTEPAPTDTPVETATETPPIYVTPTPAPTESGGSNIPTP